MGLTCASVHVLLNETSTLDQLSKALGERIGADVVDRPDEADRHLVVVPAAPWVSVFDADGPDAPTPEMADLGKQLSAAASAPALLLSVLDSDAFGFLLFERGKQVDGGASARGLLPGRVKKLTPEKRAAEWSRVFGRPFTVEEVGELNQPLGLFADDRLVQLCRLVGLSPERAAVTQRDLDERPPPGRRDFYFRLRAGSAAPLKQVGGLYFSDGPVKQLGLRPREESHIFYEVSAPAGAVAEPVYEFAGSAVDQGLVELSAANAIWHLGLAHVRAGGTRRVDAEVAFAEVDGRRVWRATLRGFSAAACSFPRGKPSWVALWATLRALAPGAGEVQGFCLPNPSERYPLTPTFAIEVSRG